jgi:hypothetical protein
MERQYELTGKGDSDRTFYTVDGTKESITTVADNEDVLQQNYKGRNEDGFDSTHSIRRVAHIDLSTVRLLAIVRKDSDAMAYLHDHDTQARDRMIRHYPDLFKACSGGV